MITLRGNYFCKKFRLCKYTVYTVHCVHFNKEHVVCTICYQISVYKQSVRLQAKCTLTSINKIKL